MMIEQHEVLAGAPAAGSLPLKNGRHEAFAQSCLTMSMAAAYREHYPGARQWKAQSVAESASKLAAKIAPRIEWLKKQAAHEEIVSLIEVKKLLSVIIRDGSEPTVARLGAMDRMAKLESWGTTTSEKQTQVTFNFCNQEGVPLL